MKIYFNNKGNYNNYISFNKFNLCEIPYLSLHKYFIQSKENIYFLILSFLQLMTHHKLAIFPSHWSPTGAFSTSIPLLICYLLELFSIILQYIREYRKTNLYNHKQIPYLKSNSIDYIFNKDIQQGNILKIEHNHVVPVDCILLQVEHETYGKINLSNLNGEPDMISKQCITHTSLSDIKEIHIIEVHNNKHSLHYIEGNLLCIEKSKTRKIEFNRSHFIPGGAINVGSPIYVIVTEVGKQIRSYSFPNSNIFTTNYLDKYIGKINRDYFYILLLCISICFIMNIQYLNFFTVIQFIFQSFIIFNGIIPFSLKLFMIINRSIQTSKHNRPDCEYLEIKANDILPYSNYLVCDKTGTLTDNKLSLEYFFTNQGQDRKIETISKIKMDNTLLAQTILMSIIIENDIFDTTEDKIIHDKISQLGYMIQRKSNLITIISHQDNKHSYNKEKISRFEIYKMFPFNTTHKFSAVVCKDCIQNQTWIIVKGSIVKIKTIINTTTQLVKDETILNSTYPYLRTIGMCIFQTHINLSDITSQILNKYMESKQFRYLTILGIKDTIQTSVPSTIRFLQQQKIHVSICTGDRKETAIDICKRTSLYQNELLVYFSNKINYNIKKPFIFIFDNKIIDQYYDTSLFHYLTLQSKSFIGYSLIPKHKQMMVKLLKKKYIVSAIGDGNNDIPMLQESNIAISIDTGLNNNVVSNSHIKLNHFYLLTHVYKQSEYYLEFNKLTVFMILFKTLVFHGVLLSHIYQNNGQMNHIPFTFLDIQSLNILWTTIPLITCNLIQKKTIRYKTLDYYMYLPIFSILNVSLIYQFDISIYISVVISYNILLYYILQHKKYNTTLSISFIFTFILFSLYICNM